MNEAPTYFRLVGWFCFTSHRQQGHLERAPPFTVPCKGREDFTSFPPGIDPRSVTLQSNTLPLRHAIWKSGKNQGNEIKSQGNS